MKNEMKDLSFEFGLAIVKHHSKLMKKQITPLASQLLRSGTAVGALYREAEFAQSRADFINKLSVARKECNESLYWLELLHCTGFIEPSDYEALSKEARSLLNLLTAIIRTTVANTSKKSPRPNRQSVIRNL